MVNVLVPRFPFASFAAIPTAGLPIKPAPGFAWETNVNNWVVAASGTASAIQTAVDNAAASNKTTVAIPSGDVNFGGNMVISNPNAHVWARQLNMERSTLSADVQGGTLWVLGLKTESAGPKIRATGGGRVEVLGTFLYQTNQIDPDTSQPAFELVNSSGSFAGLVEVDAGLPYNTLVKETRGSTTQLFLRLENPGGFRLGLYAGYEKQVSSVSQPTLRNGSSARTPHPLGISPGTEVFDCRGVQIPASALRANMPGRVAVRVTRDSHNVVARRVVKF